MNILRIMVIGAVNVSKELKNGFVIIDCVIIIGLYTAHCSSLTTFTGQEKPI